MSLGEYSLEAHLNFVTQGDAPWDGTPLPTQYQTHLSMEPTVGLSETFAIGFMFLSAWEPGYTPQFAGWRVSKPMTHAKFFRADKLRREHRSEGVADAEQRSELLKDSASRIVRSGNDLLSGERSEIVPEFRPQKHVRDQTELHASAGAEDDFPYIVRGETGDLRNRLWKRRWTGDDIFFRAGTSGEKRPQTMLALLEVEQ
jgi:hypothetical protein